jgi:serine/threonine protein kinase
VEQLGKYQIVRRLAAGGMAELYLGKQSGLEGFEKTVVIKRLHSSLASRKDLVEMFLNEARIAARLNHPNCVQIYDLGQADGQYFIAMEYIHGPDLMALQRAAKRRKQLLPPPITCYIMAAVCRGLHHAHELRDHTSGEKLKLVHRDVSPHNVQVTYNGDIKLVDFGVAKANTLAAATQAGVLKGKFAYMSPEQCRGDPLDARSDIFAAGILLHELLTRRRLFRRNSDFATMRAVLEEPIPSPSLVAKDLPPAIEAVVTRALSRELDQRYQDAQQMQLALEGAMRDADWRIGPLEVAEYIGELFPNRDALPAEDSLGGSVSATVGGARSSTPNLDPQASGSLLGGLARAPGEASPAPASSQAPLPSLADEQGGGAPPPEPATMIEQGPRSVPFGGGNQPAEVVVPSNALQSSTLRPIPAPEPVSGLAPEMAPEPETSLVSTATQETAAVSSAPVSSSPVSSAPPVRDPAQSARPQPLPPPVVPPPVVPPQASSPAPVPAQRPAAPSPAPAPAARSVAAAPTRPAQPTPAPRAIAPVPAPAPAAEPAFAPEGMLGTMMDDDLDGGDSTVMTSAPTGLGFDVGDDESVPMMPMTGSSPFAQPEADPLAPEELLGDIDAFDDDDATVAGPSPMALDGEAGMAVSVTHEPSTAVDEPEELATTPLLSPAGPDSPGFFDVDDKTPATALDATLLEGSRGASLSTAPIADEAVTSQAFSPQPVDDGTDPVLPALGPTPGAFDEDEATMASLRSAPRPPTRSKDADRLFGEAPGGPVASQNAEALSEAATNDYGTTPEAGWGATAAQPPVSPPLPPAAAAPVAAPAATPFQPAPAPAVLPQQPVTQPAPRPAQQAAFAPTIAPAPPVAAAGSTPIAPQMTSPTSASTPAMSVQITTTPAPVDQRNVATQAIEVPDISGRRSLMPLIIAGLALLFVGLGVALVLMLKGGGDKGPNATSIRVTTNPAGARIFLDGKEAVGRTPLVIPHPPTGKKLWLVAMKKNYKAAKRKVSLKVGQQLKVDFSLVAEAGAKSGRGKLQVRSDPGGADVFLDGTRRGATPLDLEHVTTDQAHVVVVRKEGFQDGVQKVSLEPNKTMTVKLKLLPAEKAKPEPKRQPAKAAKPIEIPRGRRAGLRDKTGTVVPK